MAVDKVFTAANGMRYRASLKEVSYSPDCEMTMRLYDCKDWSAPRHIGYVAELFSGGTISKPEFYARGPLCRSEDAARLCARICLISRLMVISKKYEDLIARLTAKHR